MESLPYFNKKYRPHRIGGDIAWQKRNMWKLAEVEREEDGEIIAETLWQNR